MPETPCYEEMFSNLISKLKKKDKVLEVSSQFGPDKSLDDMVSYLWNLDEVHTCILPPVVKPQKSEEEADRLRAEGNKCFQRKLLDKALKLYNLSIVSAPHPKVTIGKEPISNDEVMLGNPETEYKALALGYANRSAVLLELEQYETCIRDIDLALKHGYPELLRIKLAERKSKCLISLGRKGEAKQVIEDALKQLNDLQLDESKSKVSRNSLNDLLQICKEESDDKEDITQRDNEVVALLAEASKDELLFSYQSPEPPELTHPNPAIPCLSDAVKVEYSNSQGRYLVAERNISPGEVLVVEKAYGQVLHLDSSLRTHCCVCLKRCLSPFPCPICPRVIFCSTKCRDEGLSSSHGLECSILPTLAALDMGKNAVLAYRMLLQTPFSELKTLIPLYNKEILEFSPEMLGFKNETGNIYDSADYRTIYHLVTNKEKRAVSDLFKRCSMAVILVYLLIESRKYFVTDLKEPFDPSQDDIILAGFTLLTHLMNLPCNAHSITELQVDVSNFQKSASQEIGSGAFGVLSLTNHTCNPSTARFSYGNTIVLKAIKFIPKGSEVTDSYGEHYGLKSPTQRKLVLQQQYYFTCGCESCEDNWPTYLGLSTNYSLKCLVCEKKIDSKGICINCKFSFTDSLSKNKTSHDLNTREEVEKKIKQGIREYEIAYEKIVNGDSSSQSRDSLCKLISLIDRYVKQPCKIYFEAQETLKHYFERQGSCVFRKEV